MKKIIVMAAVAMMAAMSASAQNGYDETKHEIGITYGVGANSDIIDAYEKIGGALVGAKYENEKYFGPISAEYFYHVKPWLGVGGIFAYGQSKQDVYTLGSKDGEMKNNYFTLMPAVKFDWLRKQHFGMYSKLAVGATLRNEKYISDTAVNKDKSDSELHLNWQASLLGIEAGSPTFRGFIELGTGEQGIALIGLRYKF
ncbi:MAG: outer membrane beta-barrel protein [Bacteroidaceae bacterium]|nr:outer membrane beta-barrel protein [Bacteroidaceae bacterium]